MSSISVSEEVARLLETGQPADALRLAKSAIAGQETERGLYYLTAQCYRALSRYDDMYEALQAEIARDPHHPATEELKAWAPYLQRDQTTRSGNDRSYSTSLDRVLMHRRWRPIHVVSTIRSGYPTPATTSAVFRPAHFLPHSRFGLGARN